MFRMLQFPEATTRDPEIDVWLTKHPDELHAIAQRWFARMRQCGSDVRELMHDGYPRRLRYGVESDDDRKRSEKDGAKDQA